MSPLSSAISEWTSLRSFSGGAKLLLPEKLTRSTHLLGCKHPRGGSLSLPTFCGIGLLFEASFLSADYNAYRSSILRDISGGMFFCAKLFLSCLAQTAYEFILDFDVLLLYAVFFVLL